MPKHSFRSVVDNLVRRSTKKSHSSISSKEEMKDSDGETQTSFEDLSQDVASTKGKADRIAKNNLLLQLFLFFRELHLE